MKDCLVIFIKSPIPGEVKTRLSPPLASERACEIYSAFIHDILKQTSKLPYTQKIVAYSGKLSALKKLIPHSFTCIPQGKGDLGQRIERLFQWGARRRFLKTVVIGSDSPSVPISFISKAFQMLDEKDLVLGPAWDGGYYLIGIKGCCSKNFFKSVEWSKSYTLLQTLQRMKVLRRNVGILPAWYDIDNFMDLRFLWLDLLCGQRKMKTLSYMEGMDFFKKRE